MISDDLKYKLKRKIYKGISTPEHWLIGGTSEPNDIAKANALRYCIELYHRLGYPDCIASTVESGLYVRYSICIYSIILECYNSGEVAFLINDNLNKYIIVSIDCISPFYPIHELSSLQISRKDLQNV